MNNDLSTFLKGFAMGAANVVPGVSGGTIAFITGIYERLINALKSFDAEAIKMGLRCDFAGLGKKCDLRFLCGLGLGVVISIFTLAEVVLWGLENHPILVRALFFGLIAASIPSVGKMVRKWSISVIVAFVVGLAIAVSMAFLKPAEPSDHPIYLALCGIVAMCSMIIPGLSGSFVLLLMGNYELIFNAVSDLRALEFGKALPIIIPVGLGAVLGLLALSRILSWLFKNYHDVAVSSITGFIVGSLVIIWPWKDTIQAEMTRGGETKPKDAGYENWRLPDFSSSATWLEISCLVAGVVLILLVEKMAKREVRAS